MTAKHDKQVHGELLYEAILSLKDLDECKKFFSDLCTVGELRACMARENGADFTDPMTAGIFVSIAAWASHQRTEDKIPYWRTLKAGGELNPKYPGGVEAQRARLEAEGHTVVQRGRKHLHYYVQDYEKALYPL